MAPTTTIRIPVATRDRLNRLAARSGTTAGELVSQLVEAADDSVLLEELETSFLHIARDRAALASYRAEATSIAEGFDPPAPEW